MRTIKFRAWDTIGKKMYMPDATDWEQIHIQLDGEINEAVFAGYYNTLYRTDITSRIILMQFTGLHDKNGTEIYEGDVARVRYKMGENKQWETEGLYRVDLMLYRGLSLSFVKLYEPTDIEVNQYPLSITLRYADEIDLDERNNHYDRIAVKDRYWDGRIENHYSNDIEILGNIYENHSTTYQTQNKK